MKLTQDLAGKHMENLRKFFQVFQGAKSLVAGQFAYFSRLSRSDYWARIFKGSSVIVNHDWSDLQWQLDIEL